MKKIFYGISVTALSIILSTASMAADTIIDFLAHSYIMSGFLLSVYIKVNNTCE